MRRELETLDAFDAHLADEGTLRGCAVQDLDLTDRTSALAAASVKNTFFLGCRFAPGVADRLTQRGAVVFPALPDVPFDPYRARLYDAAELYAGVERGYPLTPDARAYAWSKATTALDLDATLAKALHDHAITDALGEALPDISTGIGIMGGHAVARGSDDYRRTAHLARGLAEAGLLVITGGGPGAMEAANLGASLCGSPLDLDAACAALGAVPSFRDGVREWARAAFDVRAAYACERATLGIPTWFYGHEPPNVFATGIAKYFDNAIREDILLALCGAGVIFMPGAAGTVQEIFQSVTRNYYAADARDVRPLVLVGRTYWTRTVPAWPLVDALGEGRLMGPRAHLVDTIEEALALLTPVAATR